MSLVDDKSFIKVFLNDCRIKLTVDSLRICRHEGSRHDPSACDRELSKNACKWRRHDRSSRSR